MVADVKTAEAGEPATSGAHGGSFWTLFVGSIGVVYGDIGTSPLYALREALVHASDGGFTESEVFGVVSLLLWTLTLIVSLKYVVIILRADNKGEGGTLSLLALAIKAMGRRSFLLAIGVVGASLFYGDAVITPAISVLSAVEGLKIVAPGFDGYVLPITMAILVGLFAIQARGTGSVAKWFGPITLVWFLVMALLGLLHIGDRPDILWAISPDRAVTFIWNHGFISLAVLGSVFLAVTGAEALYADMGHFGRRPIRLAWGFIVFPALALNYLGQGALILNDFAAIENPFFLLAPEWGVLPLVCLATVATVIASQAVITGAFSVTQQAMLLGLLPRMKVSHTSETQFGQIYIARVNWCLLLVVLALVFVFQSSSELASAYGIAVTGDMVVTTTLAFIVFWRFWKWSLALTLAVFLPFLLLELVFLGSNLLKVIDGGFVPLCFAAVLAVLMWTWIRGTRIVFEKAHKDSISLDSLVRMLARSHPVRVKGTAVFLTSDPDMAPSALMHNLKHNMVLHERNIIVTVNISNSPFVPDADRVQVIDVAEGFTRVQMTFGYSEEPNVPMALRLAKQQGLKFEIMATSFFLSRRSFRESSTSGMPVWQDRIYIAMARTAADATGFYKLPANRVVELGQQFTV